MLLFVKLQYLQIFNLNVRWETAGISGILGASKVRLHLREEVEDDNIAVKAICKNASFRINFKPLFFYPQGAFFTLRILLSGIFTFRLKNR